MRYKTELGQNNTKLQAILDTVNALPEAGILPEGTIEITENGIYDVANYASAEVNVASDGEDYSKYSYISRFYNLNLFDKKEITINADYLESVSMMFMQNAEKNTTVEHIIVNTSSYIIKCSDMFYALKQDSTLKRITLNLDFSNCTSFTSMFRGLTALEIIDGNPLDISESTNNGLAFNMNYALKEVRFVPLCINKNISFDHSSQLSDVSIQSIIDGLADLTGQTAQTLSVHKDVKANIKANEEWLTAITSKNWTLA